MEEIKDTKKIRKIYILIGTILVVTALVIGFLAGHFSSHDVVLEFGMFTDSNWDVASANGFTIIDQAIEKFERTHPGVKVHYYSGVQKNDYSEWLSRKMLAGETPDVFMVLSSDYNQFCSMGMIKNLDHLIEKDKTFNSDIYFKSAFETGRYGKSQYALPYETVPTLMFVNKSLLNHEGIMVPRENWTWGELLEICKKVTKDKSGDGIIDQFGIYNYDWMDAAFSNGAVLFSDDGKECYFTNPNVSEAVKFVDQLENLNQGQKVTQEDFNGGNVAFMPLTFAEYRTYKTYPYKIKRYANMTWDCITMPAGPNGDNLSEVNTLLISIGNQTKHEKLAWEFLKLLTGDEEIQSEIFVSSQGASVLKSVTQSKEAEEMMQAEMAKDDKVIDNKLLGMVIEEGHVEPKFKNYNQAVYLADGEINRILEEDKTIDSSLKILQRTVSSYLNQ